MTHGQSESFDVTLARHGLAPAGREPSGSAGTADEGGLLRPASSGFTDGATVASREELNERCTEWLARIAAGESEALVPLYHATLPRLWSLAHRVLGTDSDTEDVLSEVYTQVWRDSTRFDATRGSALAWLAIICRSRAIDCLRRREPSGVVDVLDLASEGGAPDDDEPSPSDPGVGIAADPMAYLARAQDHRDLDGALAELGAVERQLIVLAYYRDLSQTELAQSLGLPLGTVKSRTRRALAELRTLLTAGET